MSASLETDMKVELRKAFMDCFAASTNKCDFLPTINLHVYCMYPAILKSQQQLLNLIEKSRNKCRSSFLGCPLPSPCLCCHRVLQFARHESCTRKALHGP